jgi:multiple sugar transport system ATP-binding protein
MYDHPNNVFVAGFIGPPAMNLLDVKAEDGGVRVGGSLVPVERDRLGAATGNTVTLGVRPEDLELTTEGEGIPVTVDVVEELGADAYIYGTARAEQHHDADEAADAPERPFIARVDGRRPPAKGETVFLAPKAGHVHVFDAQSGERLGD